jgi:hypothetical protein
MFLRFCGGLAGLEPAITPSLPLGISSLDCTRAALQNRQPFCLLSGSRVRPWAMSETASAFFNIADFRQD